MHDHTYASGPLKRPSPHFSNAMSTIALASVFIFLSLSLMSLTFTLPLSAYTRSLLDAAASISLSLSFFPRGGNTCCNVRSHVRIWTVKEACASLLEYRVHDCFGLHVHDLLLSVFDIIHSLSLSASTHDRRLMTRRLTLDLERGYIDSRGRLYRVKEKSHTGGV